jgi:MFS transporter, UMF1 family
LAKKISLQKNNPRVVNAWAFYDWANSVYPLVITSTIFPVYYNAVTTDPVGNDIVSIMGFSFKNTALYSYTLSLSFLIIVFIAPFLSGISDYVGKKKPFMKFFAYLGAFSCSALFFFHDYNIIFGLTFFMLASIGFSGSLVFYNAFLPEIATHDKMDRYSARGFAFGYIGSIILLLFNISMIMSPEIYGITDPTLPPRISFLLTGIWWAGFAQVTFCYVPETHKIKEKSEQVILQGFKELKKVFIHLKKLPRLKNFLVSFFTFSMGLQTVMYMAASFGDKELQLPAENLIITILIIQIVAIFGAYLFAWLSKMFGNLNALGIALIIWIGICIGAYFIQTLQHFYIIAAVVGLVMGGIQALARATYSKLLPETRDTASFFSFYDITEKLAIVIGTASFGMIEEITGSMRNSVFALTLFFIAGLYFLYRVAKTSEFTLAKAE